MVFTVFVINTWRIASVHLVTIWTGSIIGYASRIAHLCIRASAPEVAAVPHKSDGARVPSCSLTILLLVHTTPLCLWRDLSLANDTAMATVQGQHATTKRRHLQSTDGWARHELLFYLSFSPLSSPESVKFSPVLISHVFVSVTTDSVICQRRRWWKSIIRWDLLFIIEAFVCVYVWINDRQVMNKKSSFFLRRHYSSYFEKDWHQ